MEKQNIVTNVIEKILKSGIVTWGLLLLVWQIASGFNSPDFLPSPYKTWTGLVEIAKKGVLWEDILISVQ